MSSVLLSRVNHAFPCPLRRYSQRSINTVVNTGDLLLASVAKANLERWEPSGMTLSGLDGVPSLDANVAIE